MTTQKEREWNSRLHILLAPKGVGWGEGTERRSGRTFRQVMRSLLHASSQPHQTVLNMSATREAAHQAFRMACNMTSDIARQVSPQHRRITLDNESVIHFRSIEDTSERYHGTRWDGIAKDY